MSIDYKSTGTLFNELITTRLKIKNIGPKEPFIKREEDLIEALGKRRPWLERLDKIIDDLNELSRVLDKLWWEQEVLYQMIDYDFEEDLRDQDERDLFDMAWAGVNSIKLNKQRSDLTRRIDTILGEESSTVLEKSWK